MKLLKRSGFRPETVRPVPKSEVDRFNNLKYFTVFRINFFKYLYIEISLSFILNLIFTTTCNFARSICS